MALSNTYIKLEIWVGQLPKASAKGVGFESSGLSVFRCYASRSRVVLASDETLWGSLSPASCFGRVANKFVRLQSILVQSEGSSRVTTMLHMSELYRRALLCHQHSTQIHLNRISALHTRVLFPANEPT